MFTEKELGKSNIQTMIEVAKARDAVHQDRDRLNALTMQEIVSTAAKRDQEITAAETRRNEKMLDDVATIINGSPEARKRSLMEITDTTVPKLKRMNATEIKAMRRDKKERGVRRFGW